MHEAIRKMFKIWVTHWGILIIPFLIMGWMQTILPEEIYLQHPLISLLGIIGIFGTIVFGFMAMWHLTGYFNKVNLNGYVALLCMLGPLWTTFVYMYVVSKKKFLEKSEHVWECEYCGKTFDTKKECDKHEEICPKRKKVKK